MPDLHLIEHHPQRVLEAFRRGEFDQIEIIGQADEKEFFELCFQEKTLDALAREMPTARKKEEVPRWFVLAANLSLKLHLENSFLAFERVVRCGGLLSALPPEIASKHLNPQTHEILLECQGFNDKNAYQRSTPRDQDFLRKLVKEVTAPRWMEWSNGPVQQVFQSHGFFDPAGVFMGDGSYLFVPDNEAYEGSVVMWFDEHNHPVEHEKLTAPERKKAHRERCYKLVSLLHRRGDSYVYAALAVVPGNAHEDPVLYELVENLVRQVGRGVIKLLILDRGFIDGPRLTRCKKEWGLDVLLPVKKNYADGHQDPWALMTTADLADPARPKEQYQWRATIEERHRLLKCFYDLSDFHSRSLHVITAQVVFILLSYTLRQWQLWRLRQEEELAGKTPGLLQRRLNIHRQYVVIYHQHAYTQMPLVTFTREVLELAPEARARALAKIRKLEESFLTPLDNVRAPP